MNVSQLNLLETRENCEMLYNSYATLVKKGDEEYPMDFDGEFLPQIISAYGNLKRFDIALIADKVASEEAINAAKKFALECALEKRSLLLRNNNKFDWEIRDMLSGVLYPAQVLVPSGLFCFAKSQRKTLCAVTLAGGAIISPFECEEASSMANRNYVDYLLSYAPIIVCFSASIFEYRLITKALDHGALCYLHNSALSSALGRKLAYEGMPVIESISTKRGFIYRNSQGLYSFLKLS